MADKEAKPAEDMSSDAGTDTNEVVGQKPSEFSGGERPDEAPAPKDHATKGMASLGWTEASRVTDYQHEG